MAIMSGYYQVLVNLARGIQPLCGDVPRATNASGFMWVIPANGADLQPLSAGRAVRQVTPRHDKDWPATCTITAAYEVFGNRLYG
jgi:hypothetical protein